MPITESGLYVFEDIAFCNTAEFCKTAEFYKKNRTYTKAPNGSKEHQEFWDIEEDRRRHGMSMPGKLIYKDKRVNIGREDEKIVKIQELQDVHITGKHYGFLNYGRIKLTKDVDNVEVKFQTGNSNPHARKVGRKSIDFPRFIDGQYHWFKAKEEASKMGLNLVAAKARRKGFSYMEGFDCADEINLNPAVVVIVAAFHMEFLTGANQILPMSKRYLDWFELETDFNRGYIKENENHIRLGYKKEGEGHKEFGYKSEMLGLSLLNNPDAAAGKDATLIKFEESGKNPILKEALSITMSTTEDGSYITGRIDIFGTGGTKDANWADFEEIYFNPTGFNCMAFDNIWDDGCRGNAVGFFYPQQVGDPLYLDAHGNSLQEEALKQDKKNKDFAKKTRTQSDYIRFVGQRATCPKEAFSSGSDNIFPSNEIIEQLQRVEHDKDFKYLHRPGVIVREEKGVKFKLNSDFEALGLKTNPPILNFPLEKDQNVNGCYVEWITPYRDPMTGKIPKGLYRLWNDPYAHDKNAKDITVKDSLGATYIYEVLNNITPGKGDYFIGAYVGRPERMDDYNEQLLNLAEYVNGEIMFENDRGDVKGFATRKRKLHLLADEPDLEWIAELKGKSRRDKGMNMTEKRKAKAAIYLRDWLLEPRGKDSYGNSKINLHYIYDPALLRELLRWNPKGNFDRVSSLLIGMFDMKEQFNHEIVIPNQPNTVDFFNKPLFSK